MRQNSNSSLLRRGKAEKKEYMLQGIALTFLDRLERVVRLNKFHRVGDFLALQNVVVQAQVRDGKLEYLIISHGVFLEDGT